MKETEVKSIIEFCEKQKNNDVSSHRGAYLTIIKFCEEQAKEMGKQKLKAEKLAKEHFRKQRDEGLLEQSKMYSKEEVLPLLEMLQKCKEYFLLKTDAKSEERADAIVEVIEDFEQLKNK